MPLRFQFDSALETRLPEVLVSVETLQRVASVTKKTETKPVFSAGGGIAVLLTETLVLRFDFRDYVGTFPGKIYQEAPGATRGGWLHDFSTTVTIGATF